MTASEKTTSLLLKLRQTKGHEHELVEKEYNLYLDSLTGKEKQAAIAVVQEYLTTLYDAAVQIRKEAEALLNGEIE